MLHYTDVVVGIGHQDIIDCLGEVTLVGTQGIESFPEDRGLIKPITDIIIVCISGLLDTW